MADDVASLGFAVDSAPLAQAAPPAMGAMGATALPKDRL
jgi:hypothetical protein